MFLSPNSAVTGGRAGRNYGFVAGTTMLFIQAAAPVGWTRVTANDDTLLRIVGSAVPGTGGSNGFVASFNSQTATGSTTLTTSQVPAQTHTFHFHSGINASCSNAGPFPAGENGSGACSQILMSVSSNATSANTVVTDGNAGGSHNHAITTSIKYVDALVAKKN